MTPAKQKRAVHRQKTAAARRESTTTALTPRSACFRWDDQTRMVGLILLSSTSLENMLQAAGLEPVNVFNAMFNAGISKGALSGKKSESQRENPSAAWRRTNSMLTLEVRQQLKKQVSDFVQSHLAGQGSKYKAVAANAPQISREDDSEDVEDVTPAWSQGGESSDEQQEPMIARLSYTDALPTSRKEAKARAKASVQVAHEGLQSAIAPTLRGVAGRPSPRKIYQDRRTTIEHHVSKETIVPTSTSATQQNTADAMSNERHDAGKRIPFPRTTGKTLQLTPQQHAKAIATRSLSEAEAHADPGSLCFRFWHQNSRGVNGHETQGFVCGAYRYNNYRSIGSPPGYDDASTIYEIENHLNMREVDSAYISVSNNLFWVLRRAVKYVADYNRDQAKKKTGLRMHPKDVHMAVLDANRFNQRATFWAKPYDKELSDSYSHVDGNWFNGSSYEFLVWHQIPKDTILHQFTLEDLERTAMRLPAVKDLLCLDILRERGNRDDIRRERLGGILDMSTIGAMAHLCNKLGFGIHSQYRQVEQIVRNLVSGYRISVPKMSHQEWHAAAYHFWSILSICSYADSEDKCLHATDEPPTMERQTKLMHYFLLGVRGGLTGEMNLFLPSPTRKLESMHRKATEINLLPAEIMRHALGECVRINETTHQVESRRYGDSQQTHNFTVRRAQTTATSSRIRKIAESPQSDEEGPSQQHRQKRRRTAIDVQATSPPTNIVPDKLKSNANQGQEDSESGSGSASNSTSDTEDDSDIQVITDLPCGGQRKQARNAPRKTWRARVEPRIPVTPVIPQNRAAPKSSPKTASQTAYPTPLPTPTKGPARFGKTPRKVTPSTPRDRPAQSTQTPRKRSTPAVLPDSQRAGAAALDRFMYNEPDRSFTAGGKRRAEHLDLEEMQWRPEVEQEDEESEWNGIEDDDDDEDSNY